MRVLIYILIVVLLSSCAQQSAKEASQAKKIKTDGNHHIDLSFILLVYYCRLGNWPASKNELARYYKGKKVEFDWPWFFNQNVKFLVSNDVRVESNNDGLTRSINGIPNCKEKPIKGNFQIFFGG